MIGRRPARNHNFEVVLSHDASTNISSAVLLVLKPMDHVISARTPSLRVADFPFSERTVDPAAEIRQLATQSAASASHPLYLPTVILAYLSKKVAQEARLLMKNLKVLEEFTGVVHGSPLPNSAKSAVRSVENAHQRLATVMMILDSWSVCVDSRLLAFIQEVMDGFGAMPEHSRPGKG